MPEVAPHFPRDWVEFADPANLEDIFKCAVDLFYAISMIFLKSINGIKKLFLI